MSSFSELRDYWHLVRNRPILELFEIDRERPQRFSLKLGDLYFDYSKTSLDQTALDALLGLATAEGVFRKRRRMFRGDPINSTEGRPVLHAILRSPADELVLVDGRNVWQESRSTLARMTSLAERIRSGEHAPGGEPRFTDIVNIGIGGSDLGPAMANAALEPYADGPRVHYVSNIDGAQIGSVLARLNPRTTLVIVASKTFRTSETLTNARTARRWIAGAVGEGGVGERFAGVSSNLQETTGFGIDSDLVFEFGDWVGGRFSVWGPVGLSLMISIGSERFAEFHAGAWSMDCHFRTAEPRHNMPVLLALVGVWHNQVCGYSSRAILPYDQRLARLPAYFQQLEMESNGKSVALDGRPLTEHSAPVVWGEPGTNGQHAFHQLLHQGTRIVPCEFLVAASGHDAALAHHHDILVANCLAQAQALLKGNSPESKPAGSSNPLDMHRTCPGNRPSTMLVYPQLTPFVLGQLIALYEHRVFVEGAILGINSFDQWGVELGKQLAAGLVDCVSDGAAAKDADGSTRRLLEVIRAARAATRSM